MSPEQLRVKSLVEKFLQQRDEFYNDIPEVQHESGSANSDNEDECPVDGTEKTLPSITGHD